MSGTDRVRNVRIEMGRILYDVLLEPMCLLDAHYSYSDEFQWYVPTWLVITNNIGSSYKNHVIVMVSSDCVSKLDM